jgi:hypothetical protein
MQKYVYLYIKEEEKKSTLLNDTSIIITKRPNSKSKSKNQAISRGSRVTALNCTVLILGAGKSNRTNISKFFKGPIIRYFFSSYFKSSYFFSREPYNRFKLYRNKNGSRSRINQYKKDIKIIILC